MNGNFVTITLDVFDTSDRFQGARVIAIPRSAFEAASETCNGGSVTTKVFSGLTDPGTGQVIDPCSTEIGIPCPIQIGANQNAFAIAPSMSYEDSSPAYLVDSYAAGGCDVTLWQLNGTDASSAQLTGVQVPTACYTSPPAAPQAGSSILVDSGDSRVQQVSNYAGSVAFSLTSSNNWGGSCGTNATVARFFLSPQSNSVSRQGGFGYPCDYDIFPAMQLLGNGDYVVAFGTSSASYDPSLAAVSFTSAGAIQNTLGIAAGNGPDTQDVEANGHARWGDFQSARLDLVDVTQAWIVGEYSLSGTWSTVAARVSG